MIKKLSRLGNSSALVIDRSTMQLMQIDRDTSLRLTVQGRRLIVEPVTDKDRAAIVDRVMKRTGKKNADLFRRLAR